MRRHAVFRELMHLMGPNLHFKRLSIGVRNNRMQ
jgi:hypothetical protein